MMRPGLASNAAGILRKMQQRRVRVAAELTRAAGEIGPLVNAKSKQILQADIYNVPIPLKASSDRSLRPGAAVRRKTTKGSHGRWQRTGALKRRELWRTDGPAVLLTNDQNYAIHRYRLGTPGHRQIRTPGVKSVQWQQEAAQALRAQILEIRRKAVLRAMSGGIAAPLHRR